MEEEYLKKIATALILIALIVLAFLLVQPILMSVIIGLILAFIFLPVYNWLQPKLKSKELSAGLICGIVILLVLLSLWFLTPILIDQSIKIFQATQKTDFVTPLKKIFPSIFASDQFSNEVGAIIQSFLGKASNWVVNSFSEIILNFPVIMLHLLVVLFTFFFALKEHEIIVGYLKSLMPFSSDVEEKLFEYSKRITASILYGQVIIGIIQGLLVGTGFFLFNVNNGLFLTFLAIIAGVLPIIGTTIIWLPVAIYMFISGNVFGSMGILFFGILSFIADTFINPLFVSKRTSIPSPLILIGMIGGIFLFGLLGFILGPLIVAYLLVILEIYRNKKTPDLFKK